MRFKNRYLVLELWWKDGRAGGGVDEPALLAAFRASLGAHFGAVGLGSALASLTVKYYNPGTGVCVVRCSREEHRQVSGRAERELRRRSAAAAERRRPRPSGPMPHYLTSSLLSSPRRSGSR